MFTLGGTIPWLYHIHGWPGIRHPKIKYQIGACDWSIGFHSDPQALEEARLIGLEGVQVSLGKKENNMHLRQMEIQEIYKAKAKETGIQIASLAIGELNQYPYKSDPQTIAWVRDSISVAQTMNCSVVLLAFFGQGDLKNDLTGQEEVIRRLREVAPMAEKAGITLGIESWLSAEEHMRIIDAVGSDSIKVYYDVANSQKMGYDIYQEIEWLGGQICEIHMKENGQLLGKGVVNFKRVKSALEKIGYTGWMQIEGAVPSGGHRRESYIDNATFLRKTFHL